MEKENNSNEYQTFTCGNAKITFNKKGYIVKAEDLSVVMWCVPGQEEKLIGKHITEFARLFKKATARQETYYNFLENVVVTFYETQRKEENNVLVRKQ